MESPSRLKVQRMTVELARWIRRWVVFSTRCVHRRRGLKAIGKQFRIQKCSFEVSEMWSPVYRVPVSSKVLHRHHRIACLGS